MKNFKRAVALIGLCVFPVFIAGFWLMHGNGGDEKDVIIPRRSSLSQVAEILHQNEVVASPFAFKLLMRFTGGARKVRAGEFRFQHEMSPLSALRVVYYGEPILHAATVPEGYTVKQIAQVLSAAKLANETKFLDLTMNRAAAAKYHINAPTLEGYLYPETYMISMIDGEERIVDMMVHRFLTVFDKSMQDRAAALKMSMEEVVTLASIIEKETGTHDDPKLISSVFHNRLEKHMRLESDPTTIYGIQNFDGNLRTKDLRTPTPYNTYTIKGLPPGPISNPGNASLEAALSPAKTDYLYFVSNNQGTSLFSATYAEHAKRVNQWQVQYFHQKKLENARQIGKVDKK
jgi:UPF0755 protein